MLQEEAERARSSAPTAFSTGIKIAGQAGHSGEFLPVPKAREHPPYEYRPLLMDTLGPVPPTEEELDDFGYLNHIREADTAEKAGGFESKIACQRAIQNALCGLYFEIDNL